MNFQTFLAIILIFPAILIFDVLNHKREINHMTQAEAIQHITNHTIIFHNGMEEYMNILRILENPNEAGLCLKANITEDTIIIYGYKETDIRKQTTNSIGFKCCEGWCLFGGDGKYVPAHSHVGFGSSVCVPSQDDIVNLDWHRRKIGILMCGKIISYRR